MITNPEIVSELKRLSNKHGGILKPMQVVKEAKKVSSPLHPYFTWDDQAAATQWRIEEARKLLRVAVEYIEGSEEPIRVFVSLTTDREDEGGYRQMVTVLGDKELRKQLIKDAIEEMERFQDKYATLKELAGVFAAMKRTRKRLRV